jgi:hypothetical protein
LTDYIVNRLCREKPSIFMTLRTGLTPDTFQTDILDGDHSDMLLLWCRQSGKTRIAGVIVAHTATYKPQSLSLIVSATQRQAGILQKRVQHTLQASDKAWRLVRQVRLPINIEGEYAPDDPGSRLVRCSVLSLELGNGSEVISIPASEDTVRGYSPDLLVLDEAARIRDDVYGAISPMRAAHPCRLIAMTTPRGKRGWFFHAWRNVEQTWYRSRVDATQCPRIKAEFLTQERIRLASDAIYQQEYMCAFVEPTGAIFTADELTAMRCDVGTLPDRIERGVGGADAIRAALTIDVGVLS